MHPSLEDRFVIQVKYSEKDVGFCCATTPSYPKSNSFHKPNAAIGIFTKKGAELNLKALKQNWKRESYRSKIPVPDFEIVPIKITLDK